ncbi:NAD(P)/FAD-dependent oxidoreductase [Rhizobium redzepovicii]|uniref:NAD(P)/FAD-dependent oxidoreductase n=1 Tax=Rhizobium redzepovicii TaxID=2867518 RepID=UPI002870F0D3|nr:FAD-dependent oxidoreductase [Rhizobium redzepovicii]MDR9782186.1 FAD-dependent oxidoreductase [Rhizobium redzepovicii]
MNAHFRPASRRLKIAVIGSGISGASAAWALDPVHDVTLYESQARAGGHTATVDVDYDGVRIAVDTGFIVYNEPNYPNLTALFAELGIATHASDMSFSLSLDRGRLEWSGGGLSSIFAQKRNLLRPSFLWMIREILRFNRTCLEDRAAGHLASRSIGDYLDWRGFSPGFTNNYLVPMAAAIWSTPSARMLQFPAEYFVNFFDNHRLIYHRQHQWRTVTGGSRSYLDRLLQPLGGRVKLSCGIRGVIRSENGVTLIDETGSQRAFDKVILACHSDQTARLLIDATDRERLLLAAIPYQPNRVVLHRDQRLMPQRRKVWASWNYLRSSREDGKAGVAVTYWMNRLQGIDDGLPLFVTLNPDREPDPRMVFAEFTYEHPQFSADAMAAQRALAAIQGENHCHFAGAWMGYGFHEDGLVSGLAAAEALGGLIPWRTARSRQPQPDAAA